MNGRFSCVTPEMMCKLWDWWCSGEFAVNDAAHGAIAGHTARGVRGRWRGVVCMFRVYTVSCIDGALVPEFSLESGTTEDATTAQTLR
jgi:hypothetical protein